MTNLVYVGLTLSVIQLLLTIYVAAYHTVHLKDDDDDTPEKEKIQNRVHARGNVKLIVRLLLIEFICELIMFGITYHLNEQIDVTVS